MSLLSRAKAPEWGVRLADRAACAPGIHSTAEFCGFKNDRQDKFAPKPPVLEKIEKFKMRRASGLWN
jgi:hypothetical protein